MLEVLRSGLLRCGRRIPRTYRRFLLFAFIFLVGSLILLGGNDDSEEISDSAFARPVLTNEHEHSGHDHSREQACVQPDLRPDDPAMSGFFHHVPPIVCDEEEDWIYTKDSKVFISQKAANKHGEISCRYIPLLMKSDTETVRGTPIINMPNGTRLRGDHFEIDCVGSDGETYENFHASIRQDEKVLERMKAAQAERKTADRPLNVLILGFDSLSRMTYMRKLPKTFRKFTKDLKGSVLSGYNIVGDGTPQALIPILTGKTELELPPVLKRLSNPSWVDVYPFVWKEYVKNGYATAWSEDNPNIGTFTYRFVGFKEQPTDHYMRPFYVYASPYRKHKWYCLGHKTRYEVHINWFKEFFTNYKDTPKFGFGFHSEFSHDDYNLVETADDTLANFLQWLVDEGHMKHTILILMSDHGARFNQIRETSVGKQEERNPMFGFAFPDDFSTRYPERYQNFQKNLHRLSTPFDMYPTLRDVVDHRGAWRKDLNPRSISLFEEIPLNRTCQMADIENHWCACLSWKTLSVNSNEAKIAALQSVKYMNSLLKDHFDQCHELKLTKIRRAEMLAPETDFLNFRRTNDADGFRADLSARTKVNKETYQVNIETSPGDGHFEVTIVKLRHFHSWLFFFTSEEIEWVSSLDDISRTNAYGDAPKCIEAQHQELRKYCYCKA